MTESKNQVNNARPQAGRAFLSRFGEITSPPVNAHLIFWSLLVVGTAVDLWTKSAVFAWLRGQPNEAVSLIDGVFRLVMVENPGAAFGMASGRIHILVAFSVIALICIFGIFFFSPAGPKIVHVALGLFAAGVCGNLYDRIFNNGLVRDFVDVVYWPRRHWPAFNVADTMLCIAVGLMVISCILTDRSCQKHAQQHK